MRKIELLAGVVLIGLCGSSAFAQNNNFFNRGGVGLFNPIIDVVNTGDRLVVQPTVSADRKYVTLSGTYQSANLIAIQNFPVFGIANGQGGGIVGGVGGAPVQPGAGGAQIQLPVMQVISGDIGVSVPLSIQRPGPGPVLHQQGMFLISPP
jgi:hypothetical protein